MLRMLVEKRIDQYLDLLDRYRYETLDSFDLLYAQCKTTEDETLCEGPWQEIELPFAFSEQWVDHWFKGTVPIPEVEGTLVLDIDTETDTMVFINSKPYGTSNPFHRNLDVTAFAGETITIHMQAWGGHLYPGYHPVDKGRVQACVSIHKREYPLTCQRPLLKRRVDDVYALYWDVKTLRQLSKTLDQTSYHYQNLLSQMIEALDLLPLTTDPSAQASAAREALAPALALQNGSLAPQTFSVGYSHLDHAWLWPISETIRKAARTALNMCLYLEEDPSFIFLFSQPAQMEAVKKQYPTIFERVKEAYEGGRWEPNGVCYIEPDCVLPSGESLIRQNLIGRAVTAELFDGYRGDVFWLPDSFGYTAALPQILVGCGVKYFVTSKLSWNDTNRFPYDLFLWESLDGTQIPAHMIQGSYNGTMDPVQIARDWGGILHKEVQSGLLRSVGEGDGAGGTTRGDLEMMRRQENLQGAPKNQWSSVSDALSEIFADTSKLPVYRGELYLELHRGTYTSQGRIKRYNRLLEDLLISYEYLTALRFAHGEKVDALRSTLTSVWKTVLVHQFHDILPGSSVEIVNREALEEYQKALDTLTEAFEPFSGEYLLNAKGFDRPLADGESLKPLSVMKGRIDGEFIPSKPLKNLVLEWGTVSFDSDGMITSMQLAEDGRELVGKGAVMGRITIGEDLPHYWDAWDIEEDAYAKQQSIGSPTSVTWHRTEEHWEIRREFSFSTSSLTQSIKVFLHQPKVEYETSVDWDETHQLLRVSFPTQVRSNHALFDVPFGTIERATHTNTPYERARFEVPAHKWAALSDGDVTIALASDSKYGYQVRGGELSLSLLRSPVAPDPERDKGMHTFTYSMIVSRNGLKEIQEQAVALNSRLIPVNKPYEPLVRVDAKTVVVEAIKVSEDGKDVVLRLREWAGRPDRATLALSELLDPSTIVATNMIEEVQGEPSFDFGPFEVKTYRVARRAKG